MALAVYSTDRILYPFRVKTHSFYLLVLFMVNKQSRLSDQNFDLTEFGDAGGTKAIAVLSSLHAENGMGQRCRAHYKTGNRPLTY